MTAMMSDLEHHFLGRMATHPLRPARNKFHAGKLQHKSLRSLSIVFLDVPSSRSAVSIVCKVASDGAPLLSARKEQEEC